MEPQRNFDQDFARFLMYFQAATPAIGNDYMLLPIADVPLPIYRERVYCYELYHQLRAEMERDQGRANFPYSLGGEADKRAHPIMRGLDIDDAKPDLLVHTPGVMGGNLVIIEVKPVNAAAVGIQKDLRTLTAFRNRGRYHFAIYLVYGENERGFNRTRQAAVRFQGQDEERRIDLSLIDLYWHREPGRAVERIGWNG